MDCQRNARTIGSKCKRHGGGSRCTEPGCTKGAREPSDKCRTHGGGKRCTEPGCTKGAREPSDKCRAHGGGPRCIEPGCTKAAREPSDKCRAHGGGSRCTESGCTKSARQPSDKCRAHGGGPRCIEPGCTKAAREPSDKCRAHGGGSRCTESGCTKSARQPSDKCKAHGGGNRCPNCIDWIDSRCGSDKYDGYCATCFKVKFPTDARSKIIYLHSKEIRVRNEINGSFTGFIHDKPLYTHGCDCTHRRRIDHRKLIGATLLCIETDEHGHSSYDFRDEEIRYDDLFMIHSGKWIFIRFNPDGKGVDMEDKLTKLIDTMTEQIRRIEKDENTELVEIIKLFY